MSTGNKIFNQIHVRKPKRNKFDLSHEKKMSLQMGDLIPIFWKKTIPGDSFRISSEIFMRLAPMLAPIMHRVNVHVHYFKVPMRLIWGEWQSFITGGTEGTDAPIEPWISAFDLETEGLGGIGSLADYLGVPVQNLNATHQQDVSISALPFRAYQLIYNEYYRDQTLMPEITTDNEFGNQVTIASGVFDDTCTLRRSAWEKDYFTSALPWTQRGAEMLMPMEFAVDEVYLTATGNTNTTVGAVTTDNSGNLMNATPVNIGLRGDNASTTINDLRTAIRIQEWLEKNARGGSRYIEQILHHFGVISSDARLQRPEYLGGNKQSIKISEVLSTVEATEPQGNMAGHGISAGSTNRIETYCEEHCIIMGIMRVLPRTAYFDGVPKELMLANTKFEYPWPELAHLGEQEVKTYELYYDTNITPGTAEEQIFGYQSRYAEWKCAQDSVHGDFRDNLDYWHMARKMPATLTEIALNDDFVTADPTQRIFAVTDPTIHKIYAQIYHHVSAIRPLPYFGTPQL